MTYVELKDILKAEKINPVYWSLAPDDPVTADAGDCLHKNKSGWRYFFIERGEVGMEQFFANEHEACQHFLKKAAFSWPALEKYLSPQ